MRCVKILFMAAFIAAVATAEEAKKKDMTAEMHAQLREISIDARRKEAVGHLTELRERILDMNPHKHLSQGLQQASKLGELKRSFGAQQTTQELYTKCLSDTNFLQAATPIQPICLSDKSANAYLAGNATQASQLAGVCGGACVTALVNSLTNYKDCLRVLGFAPLVGLMSTCQTAGHCLSESFLTQQFSVQTQCNSQMTAAISFTNVTAAGVSEAKAFCAAGGCGSRYAALTRKNPECFYTYGSTTAVTRIAAQLKIVDLLCTQETGESDVCAVQLKALGRFECYFGRCTDSNYWCDSNCDAQYTDARMGQLCGRCLTQMSALFGSAGMSSTSQAIDQLCLKSGTGANASYCLTQNDDISAIGYVSGGSYQSQATMESRCGGKSGSCLTRLLDMKSRQAEENAIRSYGSCMQSYVSSGYTESLARSYCDSSLSSGLRQATAYQRTAGFYCAKNAAGGYCMNLLYDIWWRDTSCIRSSTCSDSCKSNFNTYVSAAGCCAGYYSDYMASSQKDYEPRRTITSKTLVFNTTTERVVEKTYVSTIGSYNPADRSNKYADWFASCYGNTSAFWATWEAECPAGARTSASRDLKVSIAWSVLAANPSARFNLQRSMRADLAAFLTVSVNQINGTLGEDTSARRQTTSKAKYTFTVNADAQADADLAVTSLDAAIASNSIVMPSTVQAVEQCSTCGASSSSAVVQGAAPPPTPVPVIGSGGGGGTSSAAVVPVAVAALAAVIALLL